MCLRSGEKSVNLMLISRVYIPYFLMHTHHVPNTKEAIHVELGGIYSVCGHQTQNARRAEPFQCACVLYSKTNSATIIKAENSGKCYIIP